MCIKYSLKMHLKWLFYYIYSESRKKIKSLPVVKYISNKIWLISPKKSLILPVHIYVFIYKSYSSVLYTSFFPRRKDKQQYMK